MFEEEKKEKKGINKIFVVGILVGILLLAGAAWLISISSTGVDENAKLLEGMTLENSPGFDDMSKDIVVSTDFDRTTESPTGLGTIQMSIWGKIRNRGTKTVTGLRLRVGVIDRQNNVLKEREVLIIPIQQATLAPNEIFDAHIIFDGFSKDKERANVRWKVSAISER